MLFELAVLGRVSVRLWDGCGGVGEVVVLLWLICVVSVVDGHRCAVGACWPDLRCERSRQGGVVTRMSCACGGVMLCSSSIWRCLWCRGDTVSSSACVFVVVTVFVIAEVQLSRGAGVAVQDYIVGVP